jgi:hypothetical protein
MVNECNERRAGRKQKSKSLYLIMIFADWRREADLSADLYRE